MKGRRGVFVLRVVLIVFSIKNWFAKIFSHPKKDKQSKKQEIPDDPRFSQKEKTESESSSGSLHSVIAGHMKQRDVLWGSVVHLRTDADGNPAMDVRFANMLGTIPLDEADADCQRKSLTPFLGRNIPFIVTAVDGDKIYCSRKLAQEKIRKVSMGNLANGKVYHGEVLTTAGHGVYIDAHGLSGLLRNSEYIAKWVPVSDYLGEGDKLDVICKEISPAGQILWVPARESDIPHFTYDVQIGDRASGKVTRIEPADNNSVLVFVRIAECLDASCPCPQSFPVAIGDTLSVQVTGIEPSDNSKIPIKVKGELLGIPER